MRKLYRIFRFGILAGLIGGIFGVLALIMAYVVINPTLPEVAELADVQLQVPLRVYSRDVRLMQVFGEKRRNFAAIEEIPSRLKNAFIAGEDARYYEHPGVDYQGILRAVWHIVKTGGEKGPGGSTITQQLARDFGFVSRKKLYTRKLKEWFLAIKIERELNKDEILELYLNKIYLGSRSYGVAAAAQAYYGKQLDELTLAESAMIASLPKAPSRINPINNPPRALERRNYVLGRMFELGYVNEAEYLEALTSQDYAFPHEPVVEVAAPYASELVRAQAVEILGPDAYTGGFKVYTTFDSTLQHTANRAVRDALVSYDRRHGFRGPEAHFELPDNATPEDWKPMLDQFEPVAGLLPALVVEVSQDIALAFLSDGQSITLELAAVAWARPFEDVNSRGRAPETVADVISTGDVIRVSLGESGGWELNQLPEVEGALVSLDPEDGALLALVGGFDFQHSKFNRAIQAKRQPGSSFKPFVYAAAMDRGMTPATLINDAPVVFDDPNLERKWRPENYSQKVFGPTRLRKAMVNSRNLVSIRVLREIGVQYGWEYALRFGFDPGDIPRDLSMALGSGAVPPLAMARGYATFANNGYLIEPYFIERIEDGRGRVIYQADPAYACRDCPERQALVGELSRAALDQPTDNSELLLPLEASRAEPEQVLPRRLAEQVLSAETHYLISSIMRDVVRVGTGKKAMDLGRKDLAGKTGTTNDQRDAWFTGFNHRVVTTAWVGFDRLEPLGKGEVGGRAALPMWMDYMRVALDGVPEKPLESPEGVVLARIDPDTGLLCTGPAKGCILEAFRRDQLPPRPGQAGNDDDDIQSDDPYEN
jgi:penicillin-binding protein 1A